MSAVVDIVLHFIVCPSEEGLWEPEVSEKCLRAPLIVVCEAFDGGKNSFLISGLNTIGRQC